ncbi:hypothetical protein N7481_008605, partial [Penicillium waksmanii]|uniref:uncharacterized protein n=1 Tax=Penicillium waksmanii TaxID=69791 RepID=UPI002546A614
KEKNRISQRGEDARATYWKLYSLRKGGISFVYKVYPYIVVKVPRLGGFEREIQDNHIRDQETTIINDLAQAVAFLELLNLAYSLKLSDSDYTAEIRADFEAYIAPYRRLLNDSEPDQERCGTSGFLGPRTDFEVYRDRCLTKDPGE